MERGVVCHGETEQGLAARGHAVVCAWVQVLTDSLDSAVDAVWAGVQAEVSGGEPAGELPRAVERVTAEDMQ